MNDDGRDVSMRALQRSESGGSHLDPTTQSGLYAQLNRLAQLIEQIQEDAERRGPSFIPSVLVQHRTEVYHAMEALGDWINEFLANRPSPSEIGLVRRQMVTAIHKWSATSLLLRHSLGKPPGQAGSPELVRQLLDPRPAGADLPALVFDDFYKHSVGGAAFRGRLQRLVEILRHEVARRVEDGDKCVRLLSLHISGAGELAALAEDETLAARVQVTCLDDRPYALRIAAHNMPSQLHGRCSFIYADALRYADSPDRPARPFDIVYGVSIFEHLDLDSARELAQGCHTLLAPDGILLAGSVTPGVPASEQILRAWLTDWKLHYRDEASWREVFAHSGFDAGHLRFDYEPVKANVVVSCSSSRNP